MDQETALPEQGQPADEAGGQPEAELHADTTTEGEQPEEGEQKKPEKTESERERARMQRGIDRRTRQLAETRAELEMLRRERGLTTRDDGANNRAHESDSEPLSLTRAELAQMVKAEAEKLAPTLREQATEVERRQGVIQSLAKTWGQERFDEIASDLDDALGGLADRAGRPKAAVEAVFEADNPAAVIEYLADPDNHDEADKISRMSAAQAGKAIARLEDRLQAAKAKAAPKASKAPAPLDAVRGGQSGKSDYSQIASDADWYAARNKARKGK